MSYDTSGWTREYAEEVGNVIRSWRRGDIEVQILDVRMIETNEHRYRLVDSTGTKKGYLSFCAAGTAAVEVYGIIPVGSAWESPITGNYYIVEHAAPEETDENYEGHPSDHSEPWVYCTVPDASEYPQIWLARRLFDAHLHLLDWNL